MHGWLLVYYKWSIVCIVHSLIFLFWQNCTNSSVSSMTIVACFTYIPLFISSTYITISINSETSNLNICCDYPYLFWFRHWLAFNKEVTSCGIQYTQRNKICMPIKSRCCSEHTNETHAAWQKLWFATVNWTHVTVTCFNRHEPMELSLSVFSCWPEMHATVTEDTVF